MIQKIAPGATGAVSILAIAVSIIFAPNLADAFSLGNIRVTGAFHKKFKAEIPTRTDGRDDLFVTFGKHSDYRRVGVERPEFLDRLTIEVADHPHVPGQKMIYITSPEPIFDPSFNIIVKAKLGGGVIIENYFLAVDFQRNLAMEAESEEKRLAMSKIAEEMNAIRRGLTSVEPLPENLTKEPEIESDPEPIPERLLKKEPKPEPEPEPKQKPKPKAEPKPEPEPKQKPKPKAEPKPKPKPKAKIVFKSEPEPVYANLGKREVIEQIRAEEEAAERKSAKPEPVKTKKAPKPAKKKTIATLQPVAKPAKNVAPEQKPRKKVTPEPKREKLVVIPDPVKRKPARKAPVTIRTPMAGVADGSLTFAEPPGDIDYEVVRGDTLYKIVKKFQANRIERDRIVAAIWLENKRSFIKGNIHGIRPGAVLNMTKVIQTAQGLSDEKANHIIKSQWAEWKKRPGRPARAVAAKVGAGKKPVAKVSIPASKIPFRDAALSALADWEADNNTELNLGEAFIKEKKNGVVDVKVPLADKGKGRSGQLASFKLERKNGRLEVVEQQLPNEKKQAPKVSERKKQEEKQQADKRKKVTEHPFVVHVASFKKQSSADEMVRLLRQKGYNAYNALTVIPGKGNWHRVVIDRFSGLRAAKDFAGDVKSRGILSYTRILKLPYAILINDKALAQNPKKAIETLGKAGVSAYITKGEEEELLLAGAFASYDAAVSAQANLAKKGFSCRVIAP